MLALSTANDEACGSTTHETEIGSQSFGQVTLALSRGPFGRDDEELAIEVVILRHEVAVLRQSVCTPDSGP